jgi:endonuclease/exonuclease/phosphatase family metal-dependent hydrolase
MSRARASVVASLFALAGCAVLAGCPSDEVSDEQHQASKPPRAWHADPVRDGNLRVVTLNVRNYPSATFGMGGGGAGGAPAEPAEPATSRSAPETDEEALLAILGELDFAVLAVQEIRDTERFAALMATLGERLGRTYETAFSTNEHSGNDQQVGIVVHAGALELGDVIEHPEVDVKGTLRSGLSARLTSTREGGADFGVMVLHLASGDSAKRATLRAEQLRAASTVISDLATAQMDDDFVILGDLNTARADREWPAFDAAIDAGLDMQRLPNESGCTSYYFKNKAGLLAPSWLDHVVTSSLAEVDTGVPIVSGAHCFERSCQPFESDGPETGTSYWGVSDHCPVYFEIRDADDDAEP